jgi:acyl dehydratase
VTGRPRSIAVGDRFELIVVQNLTRTQLVQYAGASGDYNPLHTDEVFATQVAGQPTVLAHGMLTMAMTGRILTETLRARDIVRFGGRFRASVWPGDTLTTRAEVIEVTADLISVELTTANAAGTVVFSGGAAVRPPADRE